MATGTTKLTNLVDPEVFGAAVAAALPSQIRFTPHIKIDDTLTGQPGSTIKIPVFAYIGDAAVLAEGATLTPDLLTASTVNATIQKIAKGVQITDEAVLSAVGDPIGEAARQIAVSIASKIDADIAAIALTGTQTKTASGTISYAGIVDAMDLFGEESADPSNKVIFVSPAMMTALRKDEQFLDANKYIAGVAESGRFTNIDGAQVVVSNKIAKKAVIVNKVDDGTLPALTLYRKRDIIVESDRDILNFTNVITASEHYVAALTNDAKVVVAEFA